MAQRRAPVRIACQPMPGAVRSCHDPVFANKGVCLGGCWNRNISASALRSPGLVLKLAYQPVDKGDMKKKSRGALRSQAKRQPVDSRPWPCETKAHQPSSE